MEIKLFIVSLLPLTAIVENYFFDQMDMSSGYGIRAITLNAAN